MTITPDMRTLVSEAANDPSNIVEYMMEADAPSFTSEQRAWIMGQLRAIEMKA
jgi:hypothetical protein